MQNPNSTFWSVLMSTYARRMLEGQYDKLFETQFGQKLQGLDPRWKYVIEGAMSAAVAYTAQNLQAAPDSRVSTGARMFMLEVLKDAAPEISARMMQPAGQVSAATTGAVFLGAFAQYLSSLAPEQREKVVASLATMTPEQLAELYRQFVRQTPPNAKPNGGA